VSEAVQHALTHEAIARFLNAGARVAQLRGLSADAAFLAQHGFLPLPCDATAAGTTAAGTTAAAGAIADTAAAAATSSATTIEAVLLAEPALLTSAPAGATSAPSDSPLSRNPSDWTVAADRAAVQAAVTAALSAAPRDATLTNILARLLHDGGDMQGAVDAYMRAVQIDPSRGEVFRRCVPFFADCFLKVRIG
jgi:cytochrome c-type biogenesis protein CcmH/NrfG